MAKIYPCPIKFTDCFRTLNCSPQLVAGEKALKGQWFWKFLQAPLNSSHRKRLKPDTAFKSFIISLQVVANETRQKGQAIWNIFKAFYNTPHLYKGIQSAFHNHKSTQFTNYLRLLPLLYLPFRRTIERIKSQTSSHFLWDFAGVIMRIKFEITLLI